MGTNDKVALPALAMQLEKSLKAAGFETISYEEFPGTIINNDEVTKALR